MEAQSETHHPGTGGSVEGGLPNHTPSGELDLFALVLLVRAHLWFIAACGLAGLLVMVGYTLHVKPRYDATTTVIIPKVNPAAAGLVQAVAGLDLLGGGYEIYIDILQSRNIAARVIQTDNLKERWHLKDEDAAEGKLFFETSYYATPEGLLRVIVEDEDPQLAAAIANTYLAEFETLNHQLSLTSAGQQRKYFEEQMIQEKNQLEDAEVALEQSQEKTGTLEPTVQAQANLGASEGVRAQLRARQVTLQALLQGETLENPEVKRTQAEIAQLEGQLGAMQTGGGVAEGASASKVPAQQLSFIRATREVKFHEALFEGLQRQEEVFKEQEAKDFSQVEVLDRAEAPKREAWPPRTRYSLAGLFVGLVLGIAITLLRALAVTVLSNPTNRMRYHELVAGKRST